MKGYKPKLIEPKWQRYWERLKMFRAKDFSKKPKKYLLVEFPYPSGDGLHVGHARSYIAFDILARKKRMEGYNVLYPMGWDAFGLPTENYAIKTGIHPEKITRKNIKKFRKQLKSLGLSFDWSREINTTDPNYYQWTQWIFLKMFEAGLAYKAEMPINWCSSCKIGLANEEVVNGRCERCGGLVERKNKSQWLLKITQYAERLVDDLKRVDYLEKIKAQQINWIGRSEGTIVEFKIQDSKLKISVFTTRVDTIFGVTALAIAPEHEIISNLKSQISNLFEVEKYIENSKRKSDLERTDLAKEKTGVQLKGIFALNPINQQKVPVFVADYVLPHYGGGAVMVVPAHDQRDFELAKKYNLPIIEVVSGGDISQGAYTGYGRLINSGQFSGLKSEEAIQKIAEYLEKNGLGRKSVQYKLRDWIFSRQHYWGEPIPLVFCEKCKEVVEKFKQTQNPKPKTQNFSQGELLNPGWIAVPEKDLPVKLPYVEKYKPSETGESPLAKIEKWVKTKCPKCGGPARRETDTMPNWAGSNWYYLAYLVKKNSKFEIRNLKLINYWLPVDWYNGGMEHTNLHLLYSRFVYKFLYDIGIVPTPEPYQKRTSHGMVLAEDGRKMSKSFGNVVNPDEIIKEYGVDTLRVYEMFMGPFDQAINWSKQSLVGCFRFLNRIWGLKSKVKRQKNKSEKLKRLVHRTIKSVSEDIENLKFNTAVSALMALVNEMEKELILDIESWKLFLQLLAPFAPHLAEELWADLGYKKSIFLEKWPRYDKKIIEEETVTIVVQINGKVRDEFVFEVNASEERVKELALSREKVKKWIGDKEIKKVIYVPKKIINFVIS